MEYYKNFANYAGDKMYRARFVVGAAYHLLRQVKRMEDKCRFYEGEEMELVKDFVEDEDVLFLVHSVAELFCPAEDEAQEKEYYHDFFNRAEDDERAFGNKWFLPLDKWWVENHESVYAKLREKKGGGLE